MADLDQNTKWWRADDEKAIVKDFTQKRVAEKLQAIKEARSILDRVREKQAAVAGGKLPEEVITGNPQPKATAASARKTVTGKQYSPSQNKTKIKYSDGTEEIVDGKQ
jgi:hypothetical protein